MAENKLNEIIQTSLEKIKELSETGTIIGDPINTSGGTVIIPVSKISLGFASGGVDIGMNQNKAADSTKHRDGSFGGGGGTGLTITPVGFLVVSATGDVKMLPVTAPTVVHNNNPIASVGEILEKSPDIIRKFKEIFAKEDSVKADRAFAEEDDK